MTADGDNQTHGAVPGNAPLSSAKRVVPAPWIDCDRCGWRHYPDTSRKRGSQIAATCSSCGHALGSPSAEPVVEITNLQPPKTPANG